MRLVGLLCLALALGAPATSAAAQGAPRVLDDADGTSVASGGTTGARAGAAGERRIRNVPVGTLWDYQLGGATRVSKRVGIVVRDRLAPPAPGRYNVCYVNGFQSQPDERRFWRRHWNLVLKRNGKPVRDQAWGEWLLDIRTPKKRRALARIVGRWTARCARDGFDAVEFDNLDSFSRSHGLVRPRHARKFARVLVRRAHAVGLAAAQKNRAGWDGRVVGYDFALAEECGRWRECGAYRSSYGRRVLVVEYRRRDFGLACRRWGKRLPVVLRDRNLTRRGVRRHC